MKHRYIFCGVVHGTDKICDYRLISECTKYNCGKFIRVNIPDDMNIEHYKYDGYSTTSDERTLDELGYDCYILLNGEWRKFNELKKYQPHEWYLVLEYIYGLYRLPGFDYTDNKEEYMRIMNEYYSGKRKFVSECDLVFPQFKEDKNGLNLPVNLRDYPFKDNDDTESWKKEYNRLKKIEVCEQ